MASPLLILVALVVVASALVAHARWQQRKLVERHLQVWGTVPPSRPFDVYLSPEAWRELDGSQYGELGTDDYTWFDLDLDEVLASIDRTCTGLGSQTLYRRVRNGAAWSEESALERLVGRLGEDLRLRHAITSVLVSAGKSLGRGLWSIFRPDMIFIRWWYWVFPVLTLAMIGSLVAIAFEPRFLLAVVGIAAVNMGVRGFTEWQLPGVLAPMRQMAPLLRTAKHLAAIPDLDEVAHSSISVDLRRLRPLRMIAAWVARDPAVLDERSVNEWLNLLFLLDANALFFGARHIRRHNAALRRIACMVGDVDLALGIAALRAEPRSWSIPLREETTGVRIGGAWHPLVASPVVNDVELVFGRGLIITGANASGKSTYIRAIGIAAVLARALNTCPATFWQGGQVRVRSLISGQDDLSTGRSYYQVEVDRIVELLEDARSEHSTLFLLDELLRGTNRVDRLAAGEAVLRALVQPSHERKRHCAIIATHDAELIDMVADRFDPWHFRETIGAHGLRFEYRRQPGPARTRTALSLMEAAGAPPEVVEAARARAQTMERENSNGHKLHSSHLEHETSRGLTSA